MITLTQPNTSGNKRTNLRISLSRDQAACSDKRETKWKKLRAESQLTESETCELQCSRCASVCMCVCVTNSVGWDFTLTHISYITQQKKSHPSPHIYMHIQSLSGCSSEWRPALQHRSHDANPTTLKCAHCLQNTLGLLRRKLRGLAVRSLHMQSHAKELLKKSLPTYSHTEPCNGVILVPWCEFILSCRCTTGVIWMQTDGGTLSILLALILHSHTALPSVMTLKDNVPPLFPVHIPPCAGNKQKPLFSRGCTNTT